VHTVIRNEVSTSRRDETIPRATISILFRAIDFICILCTTSIITNSLKQNYLQQISKDIVLLYLSKTIRERHGCYEKHDRRLLKCLSRFGQLSSTLLINTVPLKAIHINVTTRGICIFMLAMLILKALHVLKYVFMPRMLMVETVHVLKVLCSQFEDRLRTVWLSEEWMQKSSILNWKVSWALQLCHWFNYTLLFCPPPILEGQNYYGTTNDGFGAVNIWDQIFLRCACSGAFSGWC